MACGLFGFNNGFNNGFSGNQSFVQHICEFIGETVTIFTTSGGASGCGFTGVILAVNCDFVRLSAQQGTAPTVPLSENICGNLGNFGNGNGNDNGCDRYGMGSGHGGHRPPHNNVGSVVDIPIDRIAAFCHNAV